MVRINNFFPQITLLTRYGIHSCSFIDQVFCKVPHKKIHISSSLIISRMPDHPQCIVNFKTLDEHRNEDKFIYTWAICDSAMLDFRVELSSPEIQFHMISNLLSCLDYRVFENAISASLNKQFPESVKLNKYKHKLSPWNTTGVIKSIDFLAIIHRRHLRLVPLILLNMMINCII